MTYIQPTITLAGTASEHIGTGSGFKGPGPCQDTESFFMSTQCAYELDE